MKLKRWKGGKGVLGANRKYILAVQRPLPGGGGPGSVPLSGATAAMGGGGMRGGGNCGGGSVGGGSVGGGLWTTGGGGAGKTGFAVGGGAKGSDARTGGGGKLVAAAPNWLFKIMIDTNPSHARTGDSTSHPMTATSSHFEFFTPGHLRSLSAALNDQFPSKIRLTLNIKYSRK
jgi:hypothetical protein